ncbi:MAG TPA: heavy metal-associated domain-containing protein [Thermoanaerobaculia bacterium]|nr:heavy metal-associated domain-containing protein [Thermoanaerobaculia bacterium]
MGRDRLKIRRNHPFPLAGSPPVGYREVVTRATLRIDGMRCDRCARALSDSLGSLRGVRSAEVSARSGKAVVEYEPAEVDAARLIEQIIEEGYDAAAL